MNFITFLCFPKLPKTVNLPGYAVMQRSRRCIKLIFGRFTIHPKKISDLKWQLYWFTSGSARCKEMLQDFYRLKMTYCFSFIRICFLITCSLNNTFCKVPPGYMYVQLNA